MGSKSLNKIEQEVFMLPHEDQLRLMENLIHRMRKPMRQPTTTWDALYGLGKGVWNGLDAQALVTEMREDR